jgi:fatty acid desaturase
VFWRYSHWDAVLAIVPISQYVATIAWAFTFEHLPWQWNVVIFPLLALAFYFNPIVVVHNFLHCPFFAWNPLNRAFAAFNSANLGLPQVLYKHHHMIHHRYGNDPVKNGTTLDPTSTFRYGREGQQEDAVSYSGLSLFRDTAAYAYTESVRSGDRAQLFLEMGFNLVGYALLIAIDWKWFLLAYMPLLYAGWFLAHMENYFEHHRARDPGDRFANSVSYYPAWYNRLMFNEGFHQEHHIEPGRHWSERPAVGERYRTRIVTAGAHEARFPPLLGFLD